MLSSYYMYQRAWQDLPQGFILCSLLVVIFCEVFASYIQLDALVLLWGLRICESILLYLLVLHFDVREALGITLPTSKDWQLFFWVSAIVLLAGLVLLAVFSGLNIWLTLPSFAQGFAGIILMLLLAPIVEELFFRGIVYRLLRETFGIWSAIVLSAMCFAYMHGALLSPQLIGGLIFASAYEYTRNLWIPILLHVAGNSLIILLTWLW